MGYDIFISHRHTDKDIADVFTKHLRAWGIPEDSIFQSSNPKYGARVGKQLTDELKQALVRAQVVFLIYTFADEDWSFCMWELGVATDPELDHTNSVVFCCSGDKPKVFEGQIMVEITEDGLRRFVHQFHTKDGFFPVEKPYQDIPPEEVQKRSKHLYDELMQVIPCAKLQEVFRWDNFRVHIDRHHIDKIQSLCKEGESKDDEIHDILSMESHVLGEPPPFGQSMGHFGFNTFEKGLTLGALMNRWKAGKKQRQEEKVIGWVGITDDWVHELYSEIKRAVNNQVAQPPRYLMRSLVPDANWWFYPVLNHVRHLPDKSMQFDLYFFRFQQADTIASNN